MYSTNVEYTSNRCRNYVESMSNICRIYVESMSNLCRIYVWAVAPRQYRARGRGEGQPPIAGFRVGSPPKPDDDVFRRRSATFNCERKRVFSAVKYFESLRFCTKEASQNGQAPSPPLDYWVVGKTVGNRLSTSGGWAFRPTVHLSRGGFPQFLLPHIGPWAAPHGEPPSLGNEVPARPGRFILYSSCSVAIRLKASARRHGRHPFRFGRQESLRL